MTWLSGRRPMSTSNKRWKWSLDTDQAVSYLDAFPGYRDRFRKELIKQGHLEARLPKAMRDKIAAEKPNLALVKTILLESNETA